MATRDTSDDFFSSFDNQPPVRSRKSQAPPPPPPPKKPGAPPPKQQQQQQQPSRTAVASRRPVGNYYNTSSPAPAPQQPASTFYPAPIPANNFYAQPQPQQQPQFQQQQQPPRPSPMTHASSTDSMTLEGAMDAASQQPTFFVPQPSQQPQRQQSSNYSDEDELPLLEELGINIEHILLKTKAVVLPFRRLSKDTALVDPSLIVEDADLAGPLAFALLLGGELLLTGKIHFGYIYGFGLFGCFAMTLILNLMSPQGAVSVWTVASILGYSLLPVNILAALKIILVNIAQLATLGQILALLTILWSTVASTRLLEVGCNMRAQRYLLAYPIALLYSAFVLITIF